MTFTGHGVDPADHQTLEGHKRACEAKRIHALASARAARVTARNLQHDQRGLLDEALRRLFNDGLEGEGDVVEVPGPTWRLAMANLEAVIASLT